VVSWKGASALAVLLAALIGVLVWMNRQPPPSGRPLFGCDITNVLDVRASNSTGQVVEVARPDLRSDWRVVLPSPGPAQPEFAQQLAEDLHSVKADDVLRGGDPAQYGLDRPSRTVTCRERSGSSFTLTVGKERFDGGGYYAQKAGDPNVYVISSVPVDDFDNRLKQPPYLGNFLPSPGPTS
jgi:Domain of unknown function (DUF4340)